MDELLTEIPFGLTGRVFRSPMPFSPFDPFDRIWAKYLKNRVELVVVLTEQEEYLIRAKRDLPEFYRSQGLSVIHFPIQDYCAPEREDGFSVVINLALEQVDNGAHLAVHCMAGVGRTGIFLSCMAKRHFGMDGREAIEWTRQSIPDALENPVQERFVLNF